MSRRLLVAVLAVTGALAPVAQAQAQADWTAPATVPGSASGTAPQVHMDRTGEAVLQWSNTRGDLFAAVRGATGRFSATQRLVKVPTGAMVRGAQLAVGRDGTAVVVWTQSSARSPHYRVMASMRSPGGRFAAARLVGTAQSVFRSSPQATVDSHGDVAVAWTRDDAPRIAIRMRGHNFGTPRAVPGNFTAQFVVAFGADGRLYAAASRLDRRPAHRQTPEPVLTLYAASARAPYRIGTLHRVSAGSGVDPALVAGPGDETTLAWRDGAADSEGDGIGTGAIYAATAQAGVFGAPTVISPAGVLGRRPVLAAGPAGVIASWARRESGPPEDPTDEAAYSWVAQRATDASWPAAQPLAAGGVWTSVPGVAVDAQGMATVAYVRGASAGPRVLAVRTGPVGTDLPAEQSLSTFAVPAGDDALAQVAAAAAGTSTVVVLAHPGAGLVVFARTV